MSKAKEQQSKEVAEALEKYREAVQEEDAARKIRDQAQQAYERASEKKTAKRQLYNRLFDKFIYGAKAVSKMAVVLLVPSLLLFGCAVYQQDVDRWVQEAHPDWSQQEVLKISHHQEWVGMTVEQYECALTRGYEESRHSFEWSHWHLRPDRILGSSEGHQIRIYTLAIYSSGRRNTCSAEFVNGRYVRMSWSMARN